MSTTLEAALSQLASLEETGKSALWAKADLTASVLDAYGPKIAGQVADVLGCSKNHVLLMGKISTLFGTDRRYPDVPWGAYLLCGGTEDPLYWMDLFIQNHWSLRELKEALKALKEKLSPEEEIVNLAKRLAGKLEGIGSLEHGDKVLSTVRSYLTLYMSGDDAHEESRHEQTRHSNS
jgi:hypothetical protein